MDFNLRKVQSTIYIDNDDLSFVYSKNGDYTIKTTSNNEIYNLQNVIEYFKTISKTILEYDNKTS